MSQRNRASLFNYAERSGNYNEPVYAVRYFRMAANDVYAEFAGLTAGLINYGTYLFLGRIRRGDNYDENTGGSYSACSNVIARDMDSKSSSLTAACSNGVRRSDKEILACLEPCAVSTDTGA
jgi:hypothetical protein